MELDKNYRHGFVVRNVLKISSLQHGFHTSAQLHFTDHSGGEITWAEAQMRQTKDALSFDEILQDQNF